MSVVINGMEMPINCTHCPCSDDESRFCRAANEYIPMLGKPKFCPITEQPKAESRSVYRRLMEQGKQRWIPINEFEPVGDSVLVTIHWDDGTYEVREMEYWKGKEAENSDDEVLRETARYTNAHVTAWMPLPEAWRGEEK